MDDIQKVEYSTKLYAREAIGKNYCIRVQI